jgi:hypothetical protein
MSDVDQEARPTRSFRWAPVGMRWPAVWAWWVGFAAIFVWVLGPAAIVLGVWTLVDVTRTGGKGLGRGVFAVVVGVLATVVAYTWWHLGNVLSSNP